ncbi:unnamed protein product, partial [Didymodactylos carnosus]
MISLNEAGIVLSGDRASEKMLGEIPQGLHNTMALTSLAIWYISSGATLFSNKFILSSFGGEALSLGTNQLVVSVISGFIQLQIMNRLYPNSHRKEQSIQTVLRDMLFIGAFRCVTVVLGLLSLKYIAVSFVSTIKSSSPLFTVILSRIMTGEKTGHWTKLSMLPITFGLALCSSFELSFNIRGFVCALGTNVFECLQNVYSKLLISGERYRYTAAELQFWASLVACGFQLPLLLYNVDIISSLYKTSTTLLFMYIFNGLCYHIQSVSAYAVMAYVSPITHSVANTVKRAVLIWLSVLIFHNPVTLLSGFGTIIVIFGVILYNEARDLEKKTTEQSTLITWRVI